MPTPSAAAPIHSTSSLSRSATHSIRRTLRALDIAGSVSYTFRIGKYEISEQMIDKANAFGGLGITKDPEGLSGPNKPATGIGWYEALRFKQTLF